MEPSCWRGWPGSVGSSVAPEHCEWRLHTSPGTTSHEASLRRWQWCCTRGPERRLRVASRQSVSLSWWPPSPPWNSTTTPHQRNMIISSYRNDYGLMSSEENLKQTNMSIILNAFPSERFTYTDPLNTFWEPPASVIRALTCAACCCSGLSWLHPRAAGSCAGRACAAAARRPTTTRPTAPWLCAAPQPASAPTHTQNVWRVSRPVKLLPYKVHSRVSPAHTEARITGEFPVQPIYPVSVAGFLDRVRIKSRWSTCWTMVGLATESVSTILL